MKTRRLGRREVSAVGLGCMNVSWKGGTALDPVLRYERAIPGFHAALDAGITLLDTANIYAPTWDQIGHNEKVVAEAFHSWTGTPEQKAQVVLATKGGIARGPGETWGRNGSLDHLLHAIEQSLNNFGVDRIDLYQHHRLDPSIEFETQVENFVELKNRGLVDQLGVSNYNRRQLEVALDIAGGPDDGGIVSIQNEFSPFYRNDLDVLEVCEERGIAFLPWSPLGGSKKVATLVSGEVGEFKAIAEEKDISVPRLVLAWLLHWSPVIIALPGATRADSVRDSALAAEVTLSADDMARLTTSLPPSVPRSHELDPAPPMRTR